MQFIKVNLCCLFALCLFSSSYSTNYLGKGSSEIGGNISFNSSNYDISEEVGEIKQYMFSIEPIYNYYVLKGLYIGPILSYTGFFFDKNEFNAFSFLNHYVLTLGAKIGFTNELSTLINLFEGVDLDYNIDSYWYKDINNKGNRGGFSLSPFVGIKLIEYGHVAVPLTISYRIGFNNNKTFGDINFNVGILLLQY
jgi:hypothetical protein